MRQSCVLFFQNRKRCQNVKQITRSEIVVIIDWIETLYKLNWNNLIFRCFLQIFKSISFDFRLIFVVNFCLNWSSSRVSISLFELDSTFDFNFWNRLEKSISTLVLDSKLDSISSRAFEINSNRQKIENFSVILTLF